jgi:hypothetical protein
VNTFTEVLREDLEKILTAHMIEGGGTIMLSKNEKRSDPENREPSYLTSKFWNYWTNNPFFQLLQLLMRRVSHSIMLNYLRESPVIEFFIYIEFRTGYPEVCKEFGRKFAKSCSPFWEPIEKCNSKICY